MGIDHTMEHIMTRHLSAFTLLGALQLVRAETGGVLRQPGLAPGIIRRGVLQPVLLRTQHRNRFRWILRRARPLPRTVSLTDSAWTAATLATVQAFAFQPTSAML